MFMRLVNAVFQLVSNEPIEPTGIFVALSSLFKLLGEDSGREVFTG